MAIVKSKDIEKAIILGVFSFIGGVIAQSIYSKVTNKDGRNIL